jgi:outer membrane protein TolC
MQTRCHRYRRTAQALIFALFASVDAPAQGPAEPVRCIYPEQRRIEYRAPGQMWRAPAPAGRQPPTVEHPDREREDVYLTLDEAIAIGLANAEVIRVLTGLTASSTGQTIYDPAIINTQVDQQRGRFDPTIDLGNTFDRLETPFGVPDPLDPNGARIDGTDVNAYRFDLGLSQTKASGGTARLGVVTTPTRTGEPGLPLNPRTPSAVEFSFTQPLLQGRGPAANLAPIVIARLNTEQSFYQLKSSVQDLVLSIIQAYWDLVNARVDRWARQQQVEQLRYALGFFEAQLKVRRGDLGDTAQARTSLATFEATLIGAEANVINREAVLRNVLGLPPADDLHIIPSTPPTRARHETNWEELMLLAERNRPDILQLKLTLEADEQQLIIANNQAQPQLDAIALYRLNGLEGETPTGAVIRSKAGQFTDWQLGLNLGMPLGLRTDRAILRQQELILARDRANLGQQIHATRHLLALSLRNLDQFFDQYEAFRKARAAARVTLDRRLDLFRVGGIGTERVIYVDVLLAVTDWGNAVSAEAASLTQYNTERANLMLQSGTILEEHGIRFYEELYPSLGPLGRLAPDACYPEAMPTSQNRPQYKAGDEPSDEAFDLESRVPLPGQRRRQQQERLPAPDTAPSRNPAPVSPAQPSLRS